MAVSDATLPPQAFSTPSLALALGELRALAEVGSLLAARRALGALAPRGDGHPVMVLPGFLASDALTRALRDFLGTLGYEVHAWELGRNPGLREEFCVRLEQRLDAIATRAHRNVSLVGWSLGGMYARLIAHRMSDRVRQVVTLGSPFNVARDAPASGALARAYERLNPGHEADPLAQSPLIRCAPPVPSTSIFSERDGIAPWRCCIDSCDEKTENIRVPGSHTGMTHNPLVLYLVAERLAQREHAWKPYRPSAAAALIYRSVRAASALERDPGAGR